MKFLPLAILALAPFVLSAGNDPTPTPKQGNVPIQDLKNLGLPAGFKIPTEVPEDLPVSTINGLASGGDAKGLAMATAAISIKQPSPLRPIPPKADELRAIFANYQVLSYCPVHPTASEANPIWTKSVYLEKEHPLGYHVVALDNVRKSIVVVFRGSMNLEVRGNLMMFAIVPAAQWDTPFRAIAKKNTKFLGKSLGVHQGCFLGYQTVRDGLMNRIDQLLKENKGYSVAVTGYSYGAPLAVYAATDIRLRFPTANTRLVTFGGPRPGNEAYSALLNSLFPRDASWDAVPPNVYLRVSNFRDAYPLIPPPSLDFVHGAGQETFRNDKGEFVFCANQDGLEDPRCGLSILKENVLQPGDGMAKESVHHQYWTYMTCAPGEAYEEGEAGMIKVDPEAKKKLEMEVFKKFLAVLTLKRKPNGAQNPRTGTSAGGNKEWS